MLKQTTQKKQNLIKKKERCFFIKLSWQLVVPSWASFGTQIGPAFLHKIPKRFARETKMSPREPSGASKSQKAAFSKTLKNLQFFNVFGSRGLPREPQETQEGSQEEPKDLQNPQQKDPKLSPKNNNFLTNFGQIFGIKNAQKTNQK